MTAYCQLRRLLALLVSGRCRCAATAEAARPGTASLPQDRPDRSRGASGSTPPALSRSPCCYLAVGVVDRVGLADESNAGVGARRALTEVLPELGTLSQLHRRAPVRLLLLSVGDSCGKCLAGTLTFALRCAWTGPGYCLMTSMTRRPCPAAPPSGASSRTQHRGPLPITVLDEYRIFQIQVRHEPDLPRTVQIQIRRGGQSGRFRLGPWAQSGGQWTELSVTVCTVALARILGLVASADMTALHT